MSQIMDSDGKNIALFPAICFLLTINNRFCFVVPKMIVLGLTMY